MRVIVPRSGEMNLARCFNAGEIGRRRNTSLTRRLNLSGVADATPERREPLTRLFRAGLNSSGHYVAIYEHASIKVVWAQEMAKTLKVEITVEEDDGRIIIKTLEGEDADKWQKL